VAPRLGQVNGYPRCLDNGIEPVRHYAKPAWAVLVKLEAANVERAVRPGCELKHPGVPFDNVRPFYEDAAFAIAVLFTRVRRRMGRMIDGECNRTFRRRSRPSTNRPRK
jgi:hypothetical protein